MRTRSKLVLVFRSGVSPGHFVLGFCHEEGVDDRGCGDHRVLVGVDHSHSYFLLQSGPNSGQKLWSALTLALKSLKMNRGSCGRTLLMALKSS